MPNSRRNDLSRLSNYNTPCHGAKMCEVRVCHITRYEIERNGVLSFAPPALDDRDMPGSPSDGKDLCNLAMARATSIGPMVVITTPVSFFFFFHKYRFSHKFKICQL